VFHRFKMLAVSGALILAALLSSEPAKAQDKISIAAIVNDEVVSVYDLAGRITLAIASARAKNNEETRRRIAPQVLKGLIEERIKLQEAKRLGLAVGEEEVNQALQQIEKQNDLSSGGLENFLLRQGIAKATLVDQIESSIAWAKVVNTRMRAGIVIGDDEIDETLARIKESEGKPQQRISEIFLPINNPDQEVIVRQSAERIIEQLKSKARFESLARNFSQSASAAVGGDLGWTRQGELGGKLDAVVATLRPGEISPPIRTPGGYQIFMVKARRADPGLKGAESFLSLQTLVMPIAKSAPATDITTRMNEAKELTSQARNCPELDALGKKNNLKLSGNIGRVRAGQLPPEFQEVIRTLAVDVPSSPVRRGETIVVLMVCEREAAAPQVDPRQQVRQSIMRQRLNAAAQRYLRDLRRAAFVDVKL
jgi:peptidyl-prolyl cis-trans isomerase SurA